MRKRIRVAAGERVTVAFASPEGRLVEVNCGWPEVRGAGEAWVVVAAAQQRSSAPDRRRSYCQPRNVHG